MQLTIDTLCKEAAHFAHQESQHIEPTLFGITDGKAIGTYLEHKFRAYLKLQGYQFQAGNSASGIDFPELLVDMKVTSMRQPQSSYPFKSARQKVYGLGYSLLVFAYEKTEQVETKTATLNIVNAAFVETEQTADFQLTKGIRDILANQGNQDDLLAFLLEKNLPMDEIGLNTLAEEILKNPPEQGYLTISNALQWRLHYYRILEKAGDVAGVNAIYTGSAL